MSNLKVIPLLILVSALSFSVRLVDVVSGASSLSGSAVAASDAEDVKTEPLEMSDAGSQELEEKNNSEPSISLDDSESGLGDSPTWRDPVDDDPAYEAVRMEVFKDLSQRRADLESKERELTTREALLRAAEQELDRKYEELSQLRSQIEALLQQQSEEEIARIRSLVKIYETMKPKDAARIFDTLDLDILASVTSEMSERRLSPILAAMNPERARTVTTILAEQKQLPTLPSSN